MSAEFNLDEVAKKLATDPLSVNMKEVDEKRLLEIANGLRELIDDGEKLQYNHLSIITDALNKTSGICTRYLLVMQCTGKQSEIPEDVIDAIKFIHSFDSEKVMSMLDEPAKRMVEAMKTFGNIFKTDNE